MKFKQLLNSIRYVILKDIVLVLILTMTSSQYIIPFFVRTIVHQKELLDVNLRIIPETNEKKDFIEYYFRLENIHSDISLEDIGVDINFKSVIDEEVIQQNIGILGLQMQKGKSAENSNHTNIKIEKIFPRGVLIVTFLIRKEQFGNPPYHVWDFKNNVCHIEYSYKYLGATIPRKIKIPLITSDFRNMRNYVKKDGSQTNAFHSDIGQSSTKNFAEVLMYNLFIWFSGLLFSVVLGHVIVKWLNCALRKYIGAEEKPTKLTPTIGCLERAIYTIFAVFQQYNYIATLFGIKIAQRLITYTKITNDDELKKAGRHANVFVICNIASLFFGIVGGLLILYFTLKK